ncbi:glycosyltransferase family 2 protein [Gottfriedia sp. NPDC056225]|uniref:glycosyltransferase family 2 protein n=1 Tax=Gottfriedia sp. NPDC056225 TaxID=3345751 RepID=UPI00155A0397|nr:glycosyltransferase family 2 protein [Arthrobacter citreus]
MTKLSVVAPIYNEEENIKNLYQSITNAVKDKVKEYEIILVDDGSKDNSANLLEQLSKADSHVKPIYFEKNCGQTAALWAGMRQAKGEYISLIDADLQTDPHDILTLMPYMKEYDFANGMRLKRRDTYIKKISSRIGNGVRNKLTNDIIYDTGCPMKLMKREVAQSLYLHEGMHRFLPTLAKMNGFNVIEVEVSHREREYGVSKYGVFNRAFVGLMDAVVIGWLKKRVIQYKIKS